MQPSRSSASYFDCVAGTSTQGIITTGIAVETTVKEILDFYLDNGAATFDKPGISPLQYLYKSEPLALQLQQVFGPTTTIGAPEVETLLLLVMRYPTHRIQFHQQKRCDLLRSSVEYLHSHHLMS
jgi:uncharacterized protein